MAERIRAPNLSSGVSVQQSVGSSPGRVTCVPEQDTLKLLLIFFTQGLMGTTECRDGSCYGCSALVAQTVYSPGS